MGDGIIATGPGGGNPPSPRGLEHGRRGSFLPFIGLVVGGSAPLAYPRGRPGPGGAAQIPPSEQEMRIVPQPPFGGEPNDARVVIRPTLAFVALLALAAPV